MKARNILGTITVIVIVGGVVYAIKKSRDLKKIEEETITVEQAKDEVKAHRDSKRFEELDKRHSELMKERFENDENEEEDTDPEEGHKEPESISTITVKDDGTGIVVENVKVKKDKLNSAAVILNKNTKEEEDGVLRYDPNSIEAKHQFLSMELADCSPASNAFSMLCKLFDFPFDPDNDGDWDLKTGIMDYKVQFFGFGSKWVKEVTYADVILHYARLTNFNLDHSVEDYVEQFLNSAGLDSTLSSAQIDALIIKLNSHKFYNEENGTYGLFGIPQQFMDEAIEVANLNIDKSLTYEIEYNEFIKFCMEG